MDYYERVLSQWSSVCIGKIKIYIWLFARIIPCEQRVFLLEIQWHSSKLNSNDLIIIIAVSYCLSLSRTGIVYTSSYISIVESIFELSVVKLLLDHDVRTYPVRTKTRPFFSSVISVLSNSPVFAYISQQHRWIPYRFVKHAKEALIKEDALPIP